MASLNPAAAEFVPSSFKSDVSFGSHGDEAEVEQEHGISEAELEELEAAELWVATMAEMEEAEASEIGSVGLGLGVGCGVGLGFGGPLNLAAAVPALGQAAQGVAAGLGGVGGALGGGAAAARAAVRGLGVRGLDVGAGCGVGVGYGFGAGLMLKPSALAQAADAGAALLARLGSLPGGLQPQAAVGAPQLGPRGGGAQQAQAPQPQPARPPPAAPAGAAPQQPDPVLARALLQAQQDIAALRRQTRQLRDALCKLDGDAPVCARPGGRRRRRGAGEHGASGSSSDGWGDA
ncbi:hypothetical protein HT031_003165 [Scenedesmus sp. PABB004]|nr:hypothetical protein HT031_003165 [Scenedesmus sp. PABB004]